MLLTSNFQRNSTTALGCPDAALQAFKHSAALGWGSSTCKGSMVYLPIHEFGWFWWDLHIGKYTTHDISMISMGFSQHIWSSATAKGKTLGRSALITDLGGWQWHVAYHQDAGCKTPVLLWPKLNLALPKYEVSTPPKHAEHSYPLPETTISPLKIGFSKTNVVFPFFQQNHHVFRGATVVSEIDNRSLLIGIPIGSMYTCIAYLAPFTIQNQLFSRIQ